MVFMNIYIFFENIASKLSSKFEKSRFNIIIFID